MIFFVILSTWKVFQVSLSQVLSNKLYWQGPEQVVLVYTKSLHPALKLTLSQLTICPFNVNLTLSILRLSDPPRCMWWASAGIRTEAWSCWPDCTDTGASRWTADKPALGGLTNNNHHHQGNPENGTGCLCVDHVPGGTISTFTANPEFPQSSLLSCSVAPL